jgi:hypothetical protein
MEVNQIYYIPTILNGKICPATSNLTVSSANITSNGKAIDVAATVPNKSGENTKTEQHNIVMIGDSFSKGYAENVKNLLSDKFGI